MAELCEHQKIAATWTVEVRPPDYDCIFCHVDRLESALGQVRPALKWIENHAPEPDPHALASHAHLALDTIARVVK